MPAPASAWPALYASIQPAYACSAATPAELAAWQAAFRPALRRALGLEHIAADAAGHTPAVTRRSSEACAGYTREEWVITTEPGTALPFYLLLPEKIQGRVPLVLTPHGHNAPNVYAGIYHTEEERFSAESGDRDIAVQAAREGYIAIAPTARGFGETREPADIAAEKLSSCRTRLVHGLLAGRTPIGERVWDIARLLDWALTELPVDPARVACTGNSGGGTTTLFAAACEERITAALPGSYFCTFAASIGSIHHCECNYVPGMLRLGEMCDVAGLIAPRPFRALHGRHDEIFPLEATRQAYRGLRRIYAAANAAHLCSLWVGEGGHRYYAAGAWPFLRAVWRRA